MFLIFKKPTTGETSVQNYIESLTDIHEAAEAIDLLDRLDWVGAKYLHDRKETIRNEGRFYELRKGEHRFYFRVAPGNHIHLHHACRRPKRREGA